jgi:hypothetical protein
MSLVRYELGFYIPEDGILHSDRREHLKSCIFTLAWLIGVFKHAISTDCLYSSACCCGQSPNP